MSECSTTIQARRCAACQKLEVIGTKRCRDRLCPVCGWRLSVRRFGEMSEVMERLRAYGIEHKLHTYFLTLTVKNCRLEHLSGTLDRMAAAWKRVTERKYWSSVYGWARSTEVTYNPRTGLYHPHYHIIYTTMEQKPLREVQRETRQTWTSALRVTYPAVTDVRPAYSKRSSDESTLAVLLESFKYAVKDSDLLAMPTRDFKAFAAAIAGRRLVAYGGVIASIRKDIGAAADEDDAEDSFSVTCDCGAEYEEALLTWSGIHSCYTLQG